jgi:hypothetical protein
MELNLEGGFLRGVENIELAVGFNHDGLERMRDACPVGGFKVSLDLVEIPRPTG